MYATRKKQKLKVNFFSNYHPFNEILLDSINWIVSVRKLIYFKLD